MTAARRTQEDLWARFRESALRNVATAFESVDSDLIASTAHDIGARNRTFVAATHTSYWLVRYLHSIGSMACPSFRLVGLDAGNYGDDLVDIGREDALICLSPAPSAAATTRVARVAGERGALVVAITDSPTAPLAVASDRLLLVPLQGPSFFEAHVAALATIEMLVGFLAMEAGEAARDRIHRIQRDRRRFESIRHGNAARE